MRENKKREKLIEDETLDTVSQVSARWSGSLRQ